MSSAEPLGSQVFGALGIMFVTDALKRPALLLDSVYGGLLQLDRNREEVEARKLMELLLSRGVIRHPIKDKGAEAFESVNAPLETRDSLNAMSRHYAVALRERLGENVIPLAYAFDDPFASNLRRNQPELPVVRHDVISIILNNLPMPTGNTPWEAIIDWREDIDARKKYRRLQAWIGKMCRERLTAAEVEDELATMLDDYESYMALHHKKMRRSRVEVVLLPLLEILEDMAHFKFSGAAERLFGLFKSEVDLLESELNAPGREIAYVSEIRNRFGRAR